MNNKVGGWKNYFPSIFRHEDVILMHIIFHYLKNTLALCTFVVSQKEQKKSDFEEKNVLELREMATGQFNSIIKYFDRGGKSDMTQIP